MTTRSTSAGHGRIEARPASVDDVADVEELFARTIALGAALPGPLAEFQAYRDLCLGWYLGDGLGDAAVVRDDEGTLVAYALVCTDEPAGARWSRRRACRLLGRLAWRWARRDLDEPSRRFDALRARDAMTLLRRCRRPAATVHAHLNVDATVRQGSAALALPAHVDERCRTVSAAAWYGEVNARAGRRSAALERLGLEVVDRDVNHTLSALLGEPVERLTVLRALRAP